ncbi:MAG TPA: TadE family protein [Nitrospirota bacterium]|nr:TadE family protein [Nitrospirota bacterium]
MDDGGTAGTLRNEKGQTLVEFALTLALFLAIIFGIIEFGRGWFYSHHLGNSVRAAARYGAVLGSSTTLEPRISAYLTREISGYLQPDGLGPIDVTVLDAATQALKDPNTARHGDTVRVSVTYDFEILSGSIIPYFNGEWPITRSASMTIE